MKKENFSEWYAKVVREADIIDDRYPVKGMPVYKPYGFKLVKNILQKLSELLDKEGFEEAWFPVVIPYDIFKKESEHIKGFEEEVFWVSKLGEEEKLILRPTSETEMYFMFSLWIQSYQDLPLKIYMNNTVYRAETKSTKPLIRGREILWNEAHTAHRNIIDAEKMIKKAIEIYSKIFWDINHVPHIWVIRPEWDKFPGAEITYAADTILPDGKFLQIGTVHLLGQKFAKAFNIRFQDSHPFVQTLDKNIFIAKTKDGKEIRFEIKDKIYVKFEEKEFIFDKEFEGEVSEDNEKLIENLYKIIEKIGLKREDLDVWKYVWQTSFGISMRFAAAVISILGDDYGLVLPFETAPIQIVIVPIWYNEEQREKILNKSKEIYEKLKEKYRVYLDSREDKTPGWKFYYWEFKGVPLRIEIGPKDLEEDSVTIAVRMTDQRPVKYKIHTNELLMKIGEIIREREMKLKEKAKKYFEEKIVRVETLDQLKEVIENGKVAKAPFCMKEECAKQLKEYLHVEVRGIDLNPEEAKGKRCIYCGGEAKYWVYIGKTY